MCCDNCDHYFRCADVENESTLCCGKCEDQDDCHGTAVSGRHIMDYEDEYDDLLDDADDEDYEDDEDYDEEDDEEDDEDYDEDHSPSIH